MDDLMDSSMPPASTVKDILSIKVKVEVDHDEARCSTAPMDTSDTLVGDMPDKDEDRELHVTSNGTDTDDGVCPESTDSVDEDQPDHPIRQSEPLVEPHVLVGGAEVDSKPTTAVEKSSFGDNLFQLIEELKYFRTVYKDSQGRMMQMRAEKQELERSLEEALSKLKSFTSRQTQQEKDLRRQHDEQLQSLAAEKEKATLRCTFLEKQVTDIKDEIRSVQLVNFELEKKLSDQACQVHRDQAANSNFLSKLSDTEIKVNALVKQSVEAFAMLELVKGNLHCAEKQQAQLMHINKQESGHLQRAQRDLAQAVEVTASLRSKLAEAVSSACQLPASDSGKMATHNRKEDVLRKQLEDQLEEHQKENKQLLALLWENQKLVERHQEKVDNERQLVGDLSEKLVETQKAQDELEVAKVQAQATAEELSVKVKEAEATLVDQSVSLESLRGHHERLQCDCEDLSMSYRLAEKCKKSLEAKVETLEKQLAELQEKNCAPPPRAGDGGNTVGTDDATHSHVDQPPCLEMVAREESNSSSVHPCPEITLARGDSSVAMDDLPSPRSSSEDRDSHNSGSIDATTNLCEAKGASSCASGMDVHEASPLETQEQLDGHDPATPTVGIFKEEGACASNTKPGKTVESHDTSDCSGSAVGARPGEQCESDDLQLVVTIPICHSTEPTTADGDKSVAAEEAVVAPASAAHGDDSNPSQPIRADGLSFQKCTPPHAPTLESSLMQGQCSSALGNLQPNAGTTEAVSALSSSLVQPGLVARDSEPKTLDIHIAAAETSITFSDDDSQNGESDCIEQKVKLLLASDPPQRRSLKRKHVSVTHEP